MGKKKRNSNNQSAKTAAENAAFAAFLAGLNSKVVPQPPSKKEEDERLARLREKVMAEHAAEKQRVLDELRQHRIGVEGCKPFHTLKDQVAPYGATSSCVAYHGEEARDVLWRQLGKSPLPEGWHVVKVTTAHSSYGGCGKGDGNSPSGYSRKGTRHAYDVEWWTQYRSE